MGPISDDLSNDPAHLKEKLAAKRNAIRGMLAKMDRMERAWKAGLTWREFSDQENADHAAKRAEAIARRDGGLLPQTSPDRALSGEGENG